MEQVKRVNGICRVLLAILAASMLAASPAAHTFSGRGTLGFAATRTQAPDPPAEPSVLRLPISLSLTGLFQRCETILPKEIDESGAYIDAGPDTVGRLGVKYKVWRDPLRLSMRGNRLNLDAHVYYWIEVAQIIHKPKPLKGDLVQKLGSCGQGEPPREADIGLTTTITLATDWSVIPKTEIRDVKLLNKCSMTFLNLDQTGRIKKRLSEKLGQVGAAIDRRISTLDLRSRVEMAWRRIQKPIVVDPAGKYLTIVPLDMSVSPLNGMGDTVQATMTVRAFVTFAWGPIPDGPPAPAKALPPLTQSSPAPGGMHILVRAVLPLQAASEQLTRAVAGHKYKIAGNDVEITGASIQLTSAGSDLVEIALKMTGLLKGTAYVRGKPAFDPVSNVISLEEMAFVVESSDELTKSFAEAVDGSPGFKARLASQARWPLGEQIDSARTQLNAAINRTEGSLKLTGGISSLGVRSVKVVPAGTALVGFPNGILDQDSFVVELVADGTFQAEIEK